MSQKCEQFSYGVFFWDFWGFWVLNGPLTCRGAAARRGRGALRRTAVLEICREVCRKVLRYSKYTKYTKMHKSPNLQNLRKLQRIQMLNYGNYTYHKIKVFLFHFSKHSKVFWHFGSILYNKLLFWILDSDSVYLALYGNIG